MWCLSGAVWLGFILFAILSTKEKLDKGPYCLQYYIGYQITPAYEKVDDICCDMQREILQRKNS